MVAKLLGAKLTYPSMNHVNDVVKILVSEPSEQFYKLYAPLDAMLAQKLQNIGQFYRFWTFVWPFSLGLDHLDRLDILN